MSLLGGVIAACVIAVGLSCQAASALADAQALAAEHASKAAQLQKQLAAVEKDVKTGEAKAIKLTADVSRLTASNEQVDGCWPCCLPRGHAKTMCITRACMCVYCVHVDVCVTLPCPTSCTPCCCWLQLLKERDSAITAAADAAKRAQSPEQAAAHRKEVEALKGSVARLTAELEAAVKRLAEVGHGGATRSQCCAHPRPRVCPAAARMGAVRCVSVCLWRQMTAERDAAVATSTSEAAKAKRAQEQLAAQTKEADNAKKALAKAVADADVVARRVTDEKQEVGLWASASAVLWLRLSGR